MTTRARSALRLRGTVLALALLAVLAVAAGGAASASAGTTASPSSASAAQSSVAASQTAGATPTKTPFVNWKWLAIGLGGTLILLCGMWILSRRIKPKRTE